jgi:hypothetical protein
MLVLLITEKGRLKIGRIGTEDGKIKKKELGNQKKEKGRK